MPDRRPIKQAHERAKVAIFLQWLNARYGAHYTVLAEPDPPEAIIRSGRTTRWVEVTDAFWSGAFAKDEYSYITDRCDLEYFLMPTQRSRIGLLTLCEKSWRNRLI